jgi:hypothetical protein
VLYTSIHPALKRTLHGHDVGRAYLRECIGSWESAGFTICSLNNTAEIEELGRLFPHVHFKPVQAIKPSIRSFLQAIQEDDDEVAGIFNCDCLFAGSAFLAEQLRSLSSSNLIILERLNFSSADLSPSFMSCYGFDAFLFPKRKAVELELSEALTVGETWWDYMLPFAYAQSGGSIKTSPFPLLHHLDHSVAWSEVQRREHVRKAHESFRSLLDFAGELIDDEDYVRFSLHSFEWLKAKEAVCLVGESIAENMRATVGLSHMQAVDESRHSLRKQEEHPTASEALAHGAGKRIKVARQVAHAIGNGVRSLASSLTKSSGGS